MIGKKLQDAAIDIYKKSFTAEDCIRIRKQFHISYEERNTLNEALRFIGQCRDFLREVVKDAHPTIYYEGECEDHGRVVVCMDVDLRKKCCPNCGKELNWTIKMDDR